MEEQVKKNAEAISNATAEAASTPATASFAEHLKRAMLLINAIDPKSPTAMGIIQQVSGMLTKHPDYDASAMTEFNSAMMTAMSKVMAAANAPKEKPESETAKTEAKKAEPAKKPAPDKQKSSGNGKKMNRTEAEKAEAARKRAEEWQKKLEERKAQEAKDNEKLAKAFVASEDVVKALQEVRNVKESKGGEWKAMSLLSFINHLADIDQLTYWKVPGKDGKSTYYKANGMWITKEAFEYANSLKHGGSRIEA